jgi:hypothetical protein
VIFGRKVWVELALHDGQSNLHLGSICEELTRGTLLRGYPCVPKNLNAGVMMVESTQDREI